MNSLSTRFFGRFAFGDCGLVMFFVQKLVDVDAQRKPFDVSGGDVNPFFLCSALCLKKCEKPCNS